MSDVRLDNAEALYEAAVFDGDATACDRADRELDAVEADLSLARGRILHARWLADRGEEDARELPLFETAVRLYAELGDTRGEGEARFWVGIVHQVIRGDGDTSEPYFRASYELAAKAGDKLTKSYAARHLGYVAQAAKDWDEAHARHAESVALRREVGFAKGVAPGLLALAEVAAEAGRREDAVTYLDEAEAAARESGADGVLTWIAAAREELG